MHPECTDYFVRASADLQVRHVTCCIGYVLVWLTNEAGNSVLTSQNVL